MEGMQLDFFDGDTYVPELDFSRLRGHLAAVWRVMTEPCPRWLTLDDIVEQCHIMHRRDMSVATASARIRDLRKEKFHDLLPDGVTTDVERRRLEGGVFQYRVVINEKENGK